jgi:hypothetical protein
VPLQHELRPVLAIVDYLPTFEWLLSGEAATQPVKLRPISLRPLKDTRRLSNDLLEGVAGHSAKAPVRVYNLGTGRVQFFLSDQDSLVHMPQGDRKQVIEFLNLLAVGWCQFSVNGSTPRFTWSVIIFG